MATDQLRLRIIASYPPWPSLKGQPYITIEVCLTCLNLYITSWTEYSGRTPRRKHPGGTPPLAALERRPSSHPREDGPDHHRRVRLEEAEEDVGGIASCKVEVYF